MPKQFEKKTTGRSKAEIRKILTAAKRSAGYGARNYRLEINKREGVTRQGVRTETFDMGILRPGHDLADVSPIASAVRSLTGKELLDCVIYRVYGPGDYDLTDNLTVDLVILRYKPTGRPWASIRF